GKAGMGTLAPYIVNNGETGTVLKSLGPGTRGVRPPWNTTLSAMPISCMYERSRFTSLVTITVVPAVPKACTSVALELDGVMVTTFGRVTETTTEAISASRAFPDRARSVYRVFAIGRTVRVPVRPTTWLPM